MTKLVLLAQEIFQVGLFVFILTRYGKAKHKLEGENDHEIITSLYSSFLGKTQHSYRAAQGEALRSVTRQRERET